MESEEFVEIPDFPDYVVSNYGRVIHTRFDREMAQSPTQHGDLTVGLSKEGKQVRRSTKVLVARAFVEGESEMMDTVLQKDGERLNVRASNLAWRPRWFVITYGKQFENVPDWVWSGPVYGTDGGVYEHIFAAAIETGQLFRDIVESIYNKRPVYPSVVTYAFHR